MISLAVVSVVDLHYNRQLRRMGAVFNNFNLDYWMLLISEKGVWI